MEPGAFEAQVLNGCLNAAGLQPGPAVSAAAEELIDLFLRCVFTGSAPVRDWRKKVPGSAAEQSPEATIQAATWPVLRRHIVRTLAARFSVGVEALQGPWLPEAESEAAVAGEAEGSGHGAALRKVMDDNAKISLELQGWLEENEVGTPLCEHVAHARMGRELNRQLRSGAFLGVLTKDWRLLQHRAPGSQEHGLQRVQVRSRGTISRMQPLPLLLRRNQKILRSSVLRSSRSSWAEQVGWGLPVPPSVSVTL